MPSLVTVVETRHFQQRVATRMTDQERQDFITFIAGHPDDGVIMQGTGGVRKSRWGIGARGKSGGVRIIYYYATPQMPIFLLTLFAKNEQDNLTNEEKHLMRHMTREIVTTYGTKKTPQRR